MLKVTVKVTLKVTLKETFPPRCHGCAVTLNKPAVLIAKRPFSYYDVASPKWEHATVI